MGRKREENRARGSDPAARFLERWQKTRDREALDGLLALEIARLKERIKTRGTFGIGASATASDIAQDVAARFLELSHPPHFDHPTALRSYLWKAAWHLLVDRLREQDVSRIEVDGPVVEILDPVTTGGLRAVEQSDSALSLRLVLNLLDPADQEVLRLVYFEHLDVTRVAELLHIAPEAVRMRLVRARRRLGEKLRRWVDIVEDF